MAPDGCTTAQLLLQASGDRNPGCQSRHWMPNHHFVALHQPPRRVWILSQHDGLVFIFLEGTHRSFAEKKPRWNPEPSEPTGTNKDIRMLPPKILNQQNHFKNKETQQRHQGIRLK